MAAAALAAAARAAPATVPGRVPLATTGGIFLDRPRAGASGDPGRLVGRRLTAPASPTSPTPPAARAEGQRPLGAPSPGLVAFAVGTGPGGRDLGDAQLTAPPRAGV